MNTGYDAAFWQALDKLVAESKIVIDRPKGRHHPKYPAFVYPVDYGYLEGTSSMDGGGIDVWKSTNGDVIDAVLLRTVLIVDGTKTPDEIENIVIKIVKERKCL